MYSIVITKLADQDLDSIVLYMLQRLKNPKAVRDFLDAVEKCYDALSDNPRIYAECNDYRLRQAGYRKVRIKSYIVIYKIEEDLQMVEVLRFFHGTQDYLKLI